MNISVTTYSPLLHCEKEHPADQTSMKSPGTLLGLSDKFLRFSLKSMVYCTLLICFKGDHESLNLDATNLETLTTMKDVIYRNTWASGGILNRFLQVLY